MLDNELLELDEESYVWPSEHTNSYVDDISATRMQDEEKWSIFDFNGEAMNLCTFLLIISVFFAALWCSVYYLMKICENVMNIRQKNCARPGSKGIVQQKKSKVHSSDYDQVRGTLCSEPVSATTSLADWCDSDTESDYENFNEK